MSVTILKDSALNYEKKLKKSKKRIIICAGTGCVASGALKVRDNINEALKKYASDAEVEMREESVMLSSSGCQGFCQMGPLVSIEPDGIMYTKVSPDDAIEIVEKTILNGEPISRLLFKDPTTSKECRGKEDIPFYSRQKREILNLCGSIDPGDIDEYIFRGGYEAAYKCFSELSPEEICRIVTDSGLRGRGGGGFSTGTKWELTRREKSKEKYIICNGDEGDPGAFMDRSVIEGNPHGVIEGMLIAARAVGAGKGVVYVRAEYPLAVRRMKAAVREAEERNIIGKSVMGIPEEFYIEVMEGAGAFVCGEETALISSVMGKRGMPSPKPPYPAESGLYGKPTVINNVETLATIPMIIREGIENFRSTGTETSPGTKIFALTGHVANTGLIEVPFGTKLKEIVNSIGGGVTGPSGELDDSYFKAVQIGGPSGACLTREHYDLPLDFDSLKSIGAMVGSGGLVVMNTSTCIVQVAAYFMQFTQNESCGKCLPCREGTKQMLFMLNEIIEGRGTKETLEALEVLGDAVSTSSLCGLGKTASNPVLSTLRHFRDEYEAHVNEKICPAGECAALRIPEIDLELCKGCTACIRACPVEAITGEVRKPHIIDVDKCIRCGACAGVCRFKAIFGVGG